MNFFLQKLNILYFRFIVLKKLIFFYLICFFEYFYTLKSVHNLILNVSKNSEAYNKLKTYTI